MSRTRRSQKMDTLKKDLLEAKNNTNFMSELYVEERNEREKLEVEAKSFQNLLELQEVRIRIKQRELEDSQEKIKLLEQEVKRLKIEKLGILEGLTKVLGNILEEKVILEDDSSEIIEDSNFEEVSENYEVNGE